MIEGLCCSTRRASSSQLARIPRIFHWRIQLDLSNGISNATYLRMTGLITGFFCDETLVGCVRLGGAIGIFDRVPGAFVEGIFTIWMVSRVSVTRPSILFIVPSKSLGGTVGGFGEGGSSSASSCICSTVSAGFTRQSGEGNAGSA